MDKPLHTRLHVLCALSCAAIGGWQAWLVRDSWLDTDGFDYLWAGRAWTERSPDGAINGYWSPLYSWLLAILEPAVHVKPGFESRVMALANFLILLVAIAAFYVFWCELERVQRASGAFHGFLFVWLGWALFEWSCVEQMQLNSGFTDRLAAALIYVSGALLCRLRREPRSWWPFLLLGWALGLSYLARAGQFVIAPAFLLASVVAQPGPRRAAIGRSLLATAAFLSLSVPWIQALSTAFDEPMFGPAGVIAYATFVERVPDAWLGDPSHGSPRLPPRVVHQRPLISALPMGTSHDYWNDLARRFVGYRPRLAPHLHLWKMAKNSSVLFRMLLTGGLAFVAGLALLIRVAWKDWSLRRTWQDGSFLMIPAAWAAIVYVCVHVETRYLMPYLVLFAGGIVCGVILPRQRDSNRLVLMLVALMTGYLALQAAVHLLGFAREAPANFAHNAGMAEATSEAWRLGLRPGDPVACLPTYAPPWIVDRFMVSARVKCLVYAEEPAAARLFSYRNSTADRLLDEFARLGCKAAIVHFGTQKPPQGWRPLGPPFLGIFVNSLSRPDQVTQR